MTRKIFFFCLLLTLAVFVSGFFFIRHHYPVLYYAQIKETSEKYGLSESLVCAMIHTESRFREDAVSKKEAKGLMQLTQRTADWGADILGIPDYSYDNIFEPRLNIELGCWYISKLLDQYNNDLTLALAAYNAGSGNVAGWLADERYSKDGITLDTIPFTETEKYIERVNRSMTVYDILLTGINHKDS